MRSWFGQDFKIKLGRFAIKGSNCMICLRTNLELKTMEQLKNPFTKLFELSIVVSQTSKQHLMFPV